MSATDNNNPGQETVQNDDLTDCLAFVCQHFGHPRSSEVLRQSLPIGNEKMLPSLFVRAAKQVGFETTIIERAIEKISMHALPAVLILKDNRACVLLALNDTEAECFLPAEGEEKSIPISELIAYYAGYAILIKPGKKLEKKENPLKGDWFWKTLWYFRNNYSHVMLGSFFVNLFSLAIPMFIMNVYDRVIPNGANITLWVLTIGIAVIVIFDTILRFLRAHLIDIFGKKADILLASDIFQHIIHMELKQKPKSLGGFINNIREYEVIREFFTSATVISLIDVPFIILFLFFIWYIGGPLVFIPLAIIPLEMLVTWLVEKPARAHIQEMSQGAARKNAVLVESLSGIEVVKSLSAEGTLQKRWEQESARTAKAMIKSRFFTNISTNFSYVCSQVASVAMIVAGVFQIEANLLTLGGLIACNILSGRVIAPVTQLLSLITRYQHAKIALTNLNEIMNIPGERENEQHFLHHETILGEIKFDEVSFKYPDQEHMALNQISIAIQPGEKIGLLGKIGSGKTTFIKMLMRLYLPLEGRVTMNGIDMMQIDPTDLRKLTGYVAQESFLFSGTIRENILFGKANVSDDAMLSAAKIALTDKIAASHPFGYSMPVADRGEGLSGGQKQSICIARGVLNSPPILLLDEPTSSMDNESEIAFLQNMNTFTKDKTLILSTHKPQLLALVDKVIVFEREKIVFDGPKEKLFQKKVPVTEGTSS